MLNNLLDKKYKPSEAIVEQIVRQGSHHVPDGFCGRHPGTERRRARSSQRNRGPIAKHTVSRDRRTHLQQRQSATGRREAANGRPRSARPGQC